MEKMWEKSEEIFYRQVKTLMKMLQENCQRSVEEEQTEFNEEVAQEKPACSEIHLTLDSGRRIDTTKTSNKEIETGKADGMKGLTEPRRTDETEEEYCQLNDNPDFVTGRSVGMDEKEEYYRYYDNPENSLAGGLVVGMDKKKRNTIDITIIPNILRQEDSLCEWMKRRYHDNPENFVTGRLIGMDEKEEYYRYHKNPVNFWREDLLSEWTKRRNTTDTTIIPNPNILR